MTQLCYTLEEAARKLDMSETVLVRLSQFFKVPESAYEETGYLSFKGDLTFTDEDMRFFSAVKERILTGETLESIKGRTKPGQSRAQQTAAVPIAPEVGEASPATEPEPEPDTTAYTPEEPVYREPEEAEESETVWQEEEPIAGEIPTIQSPEPFRRAAEQSFARYKAKQRGAGKVFRNLVEKVGGFSPAVPKQQPEPARPRRKPASASTSPGLIGLPRLKETAPPRQEPMTPSVERQPAESPAEPARPRPQPQTKRSSRISFYDDVREPMPWTSLIEEAERNRRAMDTRLKTAAQILKQKALNRPPEGQENQQKQG